jgi:hypothetical protein
LGQAVGVAAGSRDGITGTSLVARLEFGHGDADGQRGLADGTMDAEPAGPVAMVPSDMRHLCRAALLQDALAN